jgi:hypothetical protein
MTYPILRMTFAKKDRDNYRPQESLSVTGAGYLVPSSMDMFSDGALRRVAAADFSPAFQRRGKTITKATSRSDD